MNPLTVDQSVMRTSLVPGILETIKININYGEHDLKIFEIGKIFIKHKEKEQPIETPFLVGAISGLYNQKSWYTPQRKADFYDIKGAAEVLLKSLSPKEFLFKRGTNPPWYDNHEYAIIYSSDHIIGYVGKISPKILNNLDINESIYLMEINIKSLIDYFIRPRKFKPFSKFPAIYRDISVIVRKEVESKKIEEIIRNTGGELVESVYLFDLYEGGKINPSEKAIAFRIWFRSMTGTLEKKVVDNIYEIIIKRVIDETGGRLREA